MGADFHVILYHDGPDLRKLVVTHVVAHITKTIRADADARMQYYPIAYRHAVIKNDIWVEHAVGADLDVFTNNNPGFDPRAGADLRGCSDRNMRSKKSSKGNISSRGNYRGGVYPGFSLPRWMEQPSDLSKSQLWMFDFNHSTRF